MKPLLFLLATLLFSSYAMGCGDDNSKGSIKEHAQSVCKKSANCGEEGKREAALQECQTLYNDDTVVDKMIKMCGQDALAKFFRCADKSMSAKECKVDSNKTKECISHLGSCAENLFKNGFKFSSDE